MAWIVIFVSFYRLSETSGDKDNMQITIDGGDKDQGSSSRKVARDVDIDNFKVLDEVREFINMVLSSKPLNYRELGRSCNSFVRRRNCSYFSLRKHCTMYL